MKRLVAQLAAVIAAIVMAVPASADDGLIAKQIIAKLNQHKQTSSLKGFDLGVQVDKGTVTMMGQVASSEQAMLALDVARRVPGVKLVVNDLYVNQAKQPTAAVQPAPTPAIQPAAAQQPAPNAAQVAYYQQQQLLLRQQQMMQQQAQYNATGAVGSAVAPYQQRRPVPIAQSSIRPVSAQGQVRPADYIDDGGLGGTVGGYAAQSMMGGGGGVVDGGYASGGYGGGAVVDSGGYGGGGGYGGAIGGEAAMPSHAWPSYASSPNYGAVSYPEQYSATAWPYIGPFYPYPQVPLGWRKVSLEWDDGWWFLDFTKK